MLLSYIKVSVLSYSQRLFIKVFACAQNGSTVISIYNISSPSALGTKYFEYFLNFSGLSTFLPLLLLHSCSFLPILYTNGTEMRRKLMKLMCNLCQVPIPPPGPISIVSDKAIVDSGILHLA